MLKQMKIGKRLIVTFMLIAIIASIAGIVGLVLLNQSDKDYSEALIGNGFVQGDIGNYNAYINKGGALVRDIINLTNKDEVLAAQAELEETKKLTQESIDKAALNCKTPAEIAILDKINAAAPKYKASRDKAIELALSGKKEEASNMFQDEARMYLLECVSGGQELMDLNVKVGKEVSVSLSAQSKLGNVIVITIIVVSLTISIILAIVISRGISVPIKNCADRLDLFSKGDLHTEVPVTGSRDEIGMMMISLKETTEYIQTMISDIGRGLDEIANGNLDVDSDIGYKGDFKAIETAIDKILISLNDTLGQINQSSDQVSNGSDQVSSGAQALSQGAAQQASSVEELAATINEISSQVKSTAENAKIASNKSNDAGDEVVKSNQKMQSLITAMAEISNSSKEIGKVIKTIEDIAFQTNILALNAAVEAARAGAAGKGFAVVADEVRNLASKSAEAAKSTTALIEGSISAVEKGTMLADETASSLVTVVDSTQAVGGLINLISTATNEQSTSITQVTLGIDQISSVVQTNSATAQESAAASEELSGQAQMLRDLVSRFKLKESHMNYGQNESNSYQSGSSHNTQYSAPHNAAHDDYDSSSKY